MLNLKHIFTAKSLKAIVVFWLTAAGLIFIFRALTSEIDWHWQPFISYLASLILGSSLSVLLLILLPQLFRHK